MANPVVVIPGYYGSTLATASDGETVWLTALGLFNADITLKSLRLDPQNPSRVVPVGIFDELPILPFLSVGVYKDLVQFVRDNQLPCFPFFYDWRKSLDEAADLLANQLSRLRNQGAGEVDIVAHSLGGLVARAYLTKHGNRPDVPRVRWLITLGAPHTGMLKTFAAVTTGLSVFTFPASGVRDMARGFPSSYELLPSDPSHPLFFTTNPDGTLSGASALAVSTWCQTPDMVSFLGQAQSTLATLLPSQIPAKTCFIYGTRVGTLTRGTLDTSNGMTFAESDQGDGTVPETSARGDGLTAGGETLRIGVPFGEHQGLISNEKVQQKILTDLLIGRPFPEALLLSRFRSEPMYVPRSPNRFVAKVQHKNGDPVTGARVRLTINGTTVSSATVPETSPGFYELPVTLRVTGARLPYSVTAEADGLTIKPDTGFLFATAS